MATSVALTNIHQLIRLATSEASSSLQAIECCGDSLTYSQLLSLAYAISEDLRSRLGEKPVVAFISENHPYVLAVIFATWLLGGTAAPLDYHAPEALMRGMLEGVKPSCVVLPETAEANVKLVNELGIIARTFTPAQSGIPHLLQKYGVVDGAVPSIEDVSKSLPTREDDAIFIYTSSASSVTNLKCIPVNHGTLILNASRELEKWRERRGAAAGPRPERFRTLGWGPFSHIMSIAHDLTVHTLLAEGCYIFGIPPSTYPISPDSDILQPAPGQAYDVGAILLQTAARAETNVFSGVPWIYSRIREECDRNPEVLEMIRGYKQLLSGGAHTDDTIVDWAKKNGLQFDVGLGMTEAGGSLFEGDLDDHAKGGFNKSDCLITDVELILIDEEGKESDSYGELVIHSKYISRGYRNRSTNSHSTDADGLTTFRTGDMYRLSDGRLIWQGRRDDYIQLTSGELLDPRIPEKQLEESPAIARACLIGNKFLRSAADFICAIIEVPPKEQRGFRPQEIMRAFAAVNKTLAPPLRVPVSRVLILQDGEQIPVTRKREIWRKALEEIFGKRLRALLEDPKLSRFTEKLSTPAKKHTAEEIEPEVSAIVAEGLGLSRELLNDNSQASFAELGMDSAMATRIVSMLNKKFDLDLPISALHDYVDLAQLSNAVADKLNQKNGFSSVDLTHQLNASGGDDVVIVGQAFKLPGEVNDEHAFWHALITKRMDVLQQMGKDRWDHDSFYVPPGTPNPPPGTINFTQMGRIEVASYDNGFFGISPAEAYYVTPSARSALEVAVEALEDANISLSAIKGSRCGVFVAQGPEFGFSDLVKEEKGFAVYDRYYGTGVADSTVSGRISYFLDIHGPNITLNTACSGGLVALENALMSIKHGSSEMAIVASVNVHVWPGNFAFLSANTMSSVHGRCATFSKDADGYVPSEGAMAFILKRKQAALRDGDKILGIVKSASIFHNGRSQGIVAPNTKAQVALEREVIARAGLKPSDIDFIEAHGTGTVLGDFMEIQAVNEVFAGSHSAVSPLVIGAAKTIFGHTESTAGLVGVAKAIQSLRYQTVPGLAHLTTENLNPRLDMKNIPLSISPETTSIQRRASGAPLRNLTLSFGFAGTIAAAVFEEYRDQDVQTEPRTSSLPLRPTPHLFVVSAKTEKALRDYIRKYIDFLSSSSISESDLPHICYTSCVAREHYRFRFATSCNSLKELIDALKVALKAKKLETAPSKPRIAFAFPGQGSQWAGMGVALSALDVNFADSLARYAKEAGALIGVDLLPVLLLTSEDDVETKNLINQTHVSQTCIFVFQCAMVEWLASLGIRPSAIIAHSLGEIAAAVTSKAIDFRTALEFLGVRAQAMKPERTAGGIMAALRAPAAPIIKRIAALGLSSFVTIAAYNSGSQHVVSGDESAVRRVVADLQKRGVKGTVLPVNQGFHSHCIDASLPPIREFLEKHEDSLGKPTIPYYSSVDGCALGNGDKLDADYWVIQARQPVRFHSAAMALLEEEGSKLHGIVDIGPQSVLAHLLKDISVGSTVPPISTLCDRPSTNTLAPLTNSLAALFQCGITPDFTRLYAGRTDGQQLRKVRLPTYPWQRQRHYPSIIPTRTGYRAPQIAAAPSQDKAVWHVGTLLGALLSKEHTLAGTGGAIVPAGALALNVVSEISKLHSDLKKEVEIKFLKPLILSSNSAEADVLEMGITGNTFTCTHRRGQLDLGMICSGTIGVASAAAPRQIYNSAEPQSEADEELDNAQIYEKFEDALVKFGPSFRCIEGVKRWSNRAAGLVNISTSSQQSSLIKRVRTWDAVLHMLGAIAPEHPSSLGDGAFLPSSLSGVIIHAPLTDDSPVPERVTVHYALPVSVAPGGRRMTATMEVRDAESGALLMTCREYSVGFVPASAAKSFGAQAPATAPTPAPLRTKSTTSPKRTQKAEPLVAANVQRFMAGCLKTIIGMSDSDAESLDASTPVVSLGLDSIAFTQLRADVQKQYSVDLPASFLGEDELTLGELAQFVIDGARGGSESKEPDSISSTDSEESSDTLTPPSAGMTPKDAEKYISGSLQTVLGMSEADVSSLDSSTPVLSLGLDSIAFTQLRADVQKQYGVDLPASFLGEDEMTLGELAEYTIERAREIHV